MPAQKFQDEKLSWIDGNEKRKKVIKRINENFKTRQFTMSHNLILIKNINHPPGEQNLSHIYHQDETSDLSGIERFQKQII